MSSVICGDMKNKGGILRRDPADFFHIYILERMRPENAVSIMMEGKYVFALATMRSARCFLIGRVFFS